jgi:hypothetical protein
MEDNKSILRRKLRQALIGSGSGSAADADDPRPSNLVTTTNKDIEMSVDNNNKMSLPAIRSIASRYGYAEVQFNEGSRVVAFKSMDSKVRVNVYHTTGTVASCLFHPIKGKTQLFRRDQSIQNLETIFANPRAHTGDGYYNVKDHCDDELRWRYVCAAVPDFCNQRQVSQIAAICNLWNEIRFDKHGPTMMDIYNSLSEEDKNEACSPCPDRCGNCGHDRAGTFCVLGTILIEVARVTDGHDMQIDHMLVSLDLFEETNDNQKMIPCDMFSICPCEEGNALKSFSIDSFERFYRQLMSFPKPIRRELIYFFLKKILHSYDLMVGSKDDQGEKTIYVKDGLYTRYYGGVFLSNKVLSAHHDYGELAYVDDRVAGGRCKCHGNR